MLKRFEPEIESIRLVPSDGGRFEVTADSTLIYSKLATHRHPNSGEVVQLVENYLHKGKQ